MKKRIAFVNGKVFTGIAGQGEVSAFIVEGDRVLAAGAEAEAMLAANAGGSGASGCSCDTGGIGADRIDRVDLGGRTVIPGFVDSHNHVLSGAVLLEGVNCFGMSSIEDVKAAVARKAAELGPGEWITGAGWIESQFKERRMPSRKDLDEAAPRNPVMLSRLFAMVAANSLALQAAGVGRGYVPASGRIDLDEDGEPTGILREGAQGLIRRAAHQAPGEVSGGMVTDGAGKRDCSGPALSPAADTERMLKLALTEYLKCGITSVLDPGANVSLMRGYASLRAKRELPLRVTAMPAWHGISVISGDYVVLPAIEAGLQPGLGDEWFRIGNLKMAIDGGLGSKTALMHEPFRDFTRATVPVRLDLNKLGGYVREAHEAGWGVGIHCCGDLAQDISVSHMVDALSRQKPAPHQRHHIVHGYFPTEYSLRAMAAHDIAVSAQPGFIYVEGDIYPDVIDERRLAEFKPLRTYLNRGIRVAINSDVSSGPYDPFVVLYGAVARKTVRGLDFGQAEALSVREALRCFSGGGVYLAYRDAECGSIEPGKLADVAVLDRDILDAPPEDLLKCRVDATVLDGKVVYLREGSGLEVPQEIKEIRAR